MATSTTRPLTPRQRRLASNERVMQLVMRISQRWSRLLPHLSDEFESASMYALVSAASTFDRRKTGSTFVAHAKRRATGACKDVCRQAILRGFSSKKLHDMPVVMGLPRDLGDDSAPPGSEFEDRDTFDAILRFFPSSYTDYMDLVFWHGYSQKEASRLRSLDESRTSQVFRAARAFAAENNLGPCIDKIVGKL